MSTFVPVFRSKSSLRYRLLWAIRYNRGYNLTAVLIAIALLPETSCS
jgi:hypothetical protein